MAPKDPTSRSRGPPPATPAAVLSAKGLALAGRDCIVDLKGISDIPGNLDEEPVRSQRLLLFAKGSTLHVPKVPGAYITNRPYSIMVAPCMAKYSESSGLEDELVLSFTDHSMASTRMAGIGVVTLSFPLKIKHNSFKGDNEIQIKSLGVVSELYPIDTKDIKYIDVNPTLKHYNLLSKLSIHSPPDGVTWVTRPLKDKVDVLLERALHQAKEYADVVRTTDARGATTCLARHTAQLEKLRLDLEAIGLQNYDRRMSERILTIDLEKPPEDLEWLTSPMRGTLRSGKAERGETILKARRSRLADVVDVSDDSHSAADKEMTEENVERAKEPEAEKSTEKTATSNGDALGEDSDDSHSENSDQLAYLSLKKRKRNAPARFEAGTKATAQNAKAPAGKQATTEKKTPAAAKQAKADAAAPGGATRLGSINPRTNMPFKREAYNPRGSLVKEAGVAALTAQPPAVSDKAVAKLQTELAALAGKLVQVTKELKEETLARQQAELRLTAADQQQKDAVAIAVKDEKISNMAQLHTQFMTGMRHGAMMARGDLTTLMPAPPIPSSNAAGSSASESPHYTPTNGLPFGGFGGYP